MATGMSFLMAMLWIAGAIVVLVIGIAIAERTHRAVPTAFFATFWAGLVFIPLIWGIFGGQNAWYAEAVGAYDFAGAIPFHVGVGVGALAISLAVPMAPHARPIADRFTRRAPAILALGLLVVLWTTWLVLMELDLNNFVLRIMANTVILSISSLVAAVLVERLKTGTTTLLGGAVGVLTGLAVATGTCVFLEPMAAGVIGLIAGGLAGSLANPKSGPRVVSLADLIAVTQLTGGVTGLLMLGLLEQSRGFFYTGSFTLPIAQTTAVVVCVVYSATISFPLALVAGGRFRKPGTYPSMSR